MKNAFNEHPFSVSKYTVLILCFLIFSNVSFSQKVKDKLLEGKIFTAELTVKGKKPKPMEDELSFKGGKFNSKTMKTENQFKPADYTVSVDSTSDEKPITFECDSKNGDDEIMHWTGTITGEAIAGTATLSKKEKVKKEYDFTGTLKTKKK